MTIWEVLDELIENMKLPDNVKIKIKNSGRELFRKTYELSDRLKLIAIVTAASLNNFYKCEDAFLRYAEEKNFENSFIKSLIDNMRDLTLYEENELSIIQIVTEVTTKSRIFPTTKSIAKKYLTEKEIEYIIFLTSYINFIAKIKCAEEI